MLTFALLASLGAAVPGPDSVLDAAELAYRAGGRPLAFYLQVPPPRQGYLRGDPMVIYLNRHGGTYTCDDDDARTNRSSIACSDDNGVADVGAFAGSDAQWLDVLSCVQDLFAPFRLTVTDVEPIDVDYIEHVVGGDPEQVGMSGGVAGVSPFACQVIPGAVTYTFADVYGNDTRAICETAAQEVAHAFGLDHAYMCEDPMTYLTGCGDKAFQDAWVPCGEFEPRQCGCADGTQNSVATMMDLFGPADGTEWHPPVDAAPPAVSLLGPDDAAVLPANTTITIVARASDDAGLAMVELRWDFSGESMFCPSVGPSYQCTKQGTAYTWEIDVGEGMRTFRVNVRDVAGNEVVTAERSIWLSTDGKGPPVDAAPPTVVLGAPLPGATMPPDTPFEVVATMVDDNGVAAAELNWRRQGQDRFVPCPVDDERFHCVVEGSTYRWTIIRNSREGRREFALRATDVVGNRTETNLEEVFIESGASAQTLGGDEGIDTARAISCGDSVEVSGADADWFSVDAPVGDVVTVEVQGSFVDVVATDGATTLASVGGDDALHVTKAEAPLSVAVSPHIAGAGPYTLRVSCEAPRLPAPPTACGAGGASLVVALLALLAARRRRRTPG